MIKEVYRKGLQFLGLENVGKKGAMGLNMIYPVVLTFGLVAILLGVTAVILSKLMGSTGMTSDAIIMINKTLVALKDLPVTWFGIIITIIGASIVIGILISSFKGGR